MTQEQLLEAQLSAKLGFIDALNELNSIAVIGPNAKEVISGDRLTQSLLFKAVE